MIVRQRQWLSRLAIAFLFTVLPACGNKASQSGPSDAGTVDTAVETSKVPAPAQSTNSGDAAAGFQDPGADKLQLCEIIEAQASATDCARYQAIQASLKDGSAAFNAPPTMERGQTIRVRLAIDRAPNSAAPAADVDALPGPTVAFQTKVGRNMAAELSGDGFDIKPLSPREQDLFLSSKALWEWDVKAVAGGDHVLSLKTYVLSLAPDGTLKQRWLQVEDRTVKIVVPAGQKASDWMDALIAWLGKTENLLKAIGAVVAAAAALWAALKFGRKPG